MLAVEVSKSGEIKKQCECEAKVIAPRNAILAGEGGMSMADKITVLARQLKSAVTGRT